MRLSAKNALARFVSRVRVVGGRPGGAVGVSPMGSAGGRVPYDLA